jgi:DNA-binding GntR family transcriptional regulator
MVGTKADDLALALEEAIVSGEIAPGTVLRQEQLSEQFAVSRTPVREALRRLAALGLVSFVPNRGVRVRTLSREELREAFLVRAELEGLATELATPRITDEGLAALDQAEKRFAELTLELRRRAREGSQDGSLLSRWVHANHAFHDVIYAAADAPYVERLAKSARRSFFTHVVWATGLDIDHLYEQNDLQHCAIRDAIAARSPQGARILAREHVLSSGRLLETILDQVRERQSAELRSA